MSSVLSIGFMTGTSMDGIDGAMIATNGNGDIQFIGKVSFSYPAEIQLLLKATEYISSGYDGDITAISRHFALGFDEYLAVNLKMSKKQRLKQTQLSLKFLNQLGYDSLSYHALETFITEQHHQLCEQLLQQTQTCADDVAVIGFHGQTLFHDSNIGMSLQMGDCTLLAQKTGIKVVGQFRQQDVKLGGQGAPLAPVFHHALATTKNLAPCMFVNCGGIANASIILDESIDSMKGFDIGPGNVLIDRLVREKTQGQYHLDRDGMFGLRGQIQGDLVELYVHNQCNDRAVQPQAFDSMDLTIIPEIYNLSLEDGCATLAALTARLVADVACKFELDHVLLCGGGWNNPVIYRELKDHLKNSPHAMEVMHVQELHWDNASLEAQLFAYLAVRHLYNLPFSFPNTTGVSVPTCGGQLYS